MYHSRRIIIALIIILQPLISFSSFIKVNEKDSLINKSKIEKRLSGYLATSLTQQRNWLGNENNITLLLFSNLRFLKRKEFGKHKTFIDIRTELSYLKYFDSLWIKQTDISSLNYNFTYGSKKANLTFNLLLRTQLFNTWNYSSQQKILKYSPFSPGTINTGIGVNLSFQNIGNLSFNLLSFQLRTSKNKPDDSFTFINWQDLYIRPELGFSFQSSTEIKLTSKIKLDSRSNIFISRINNHKVNAELNGRIILLITNPLEIRIESRCLFDDLISEKMQLKNELLIGLSVEFSKKN